MDEESKITLAATNKQEWPNSTLNSLNTFRQPEHSLSDVFLQGEDEMPMEPIPAHRCVLAATSVYFYAMFTSGLAESKQDNREISIRGVDTETLSLIVEFLYVGSCCLPCETMHRVMVLLAASRMLQVDELSHACSIYLEECLNSDNALELWLFAESFRFSDLAETCKRFVQSYLWSISRSQRVLELDHQDMAALLGLEEVNLGNAAHEDTLVELLLRWLTYNPKALDSDLLPVLSKVCWSEVSQECKDKFRETLAGISKDSSSESFQAEEVVRDIISKSSSFKRTFFCSVCAIGGLSYTCGGYHIPQTSIMEFADIDTRTGTVLRHWSRRIPPWYCLLPFHGHLYAFYSFNQYRKRLASSKPNDVLCLSVANVMNANLKVQESFDRESVWWNLIEKLELNYAHAIDEERGVVYVCTYYKQVFKLDIKNNDCSELTSLPTGSYHDRVIAVGGDLFVLGGDDEWSPNPMSTVLKYNWMNNEWKEASPMHEPRRDGAYACVDGRIYASGGWTSAVCSRNVEVYDPSLNIWTKLSPMSVPRINHGLVAVGTYLFAVGDESYSEDTGACNVQRMAERYSIIEGSWEDAWKMADWGLGMKVECSEQGLRVFTL